MNYLIFSLILMPFLAAPCSYLLGQKTKPSRDFFFRFIVISEFLLALLLFIQTEGTQQRIFSLPGVCGMGMYVTSDGFRSIYTVIACLMWMVTGLFSREYFAHYRNRNRYYLFQLITLGATVGIFLSADLFTTFIFFEVMSFASYVWVAQDEKPDSLSAAATYLAVAVIGGMVLLMGLFLLFHQTGTLMIQELPAVSQGKNLYPAALCMLVGFGAKAGCFPIHIWLPKAHPVAPAPASALLSGILTKTGIFGILIISCKLLAHDSLWGFFILILGTITMFWGAVLALFSINLKRTLACSSVSQIGFILVGIGMTGLLGEENLLAVRGTFLHMVNHSLFKLILFLVAGIVYQNTHQLDLNKIRGFGRKKPLLMFLYLMGALGIGGVPLWSGYISKTLLHESIVEYGVGLKSGSILSGFIQADWITLIEWIFLLSGGLTVAYMCKLFTAIFLEENQSSDVQRTYDQCSGYVTSLCGAVLGLCAVLISLFGTLPTLTMDHLADLAQNFCGEFHNSHPVHYFTWGNLKGSLISITAGAVIYLVVVRGWMMKASSSQRKTYVERWPKLLDLEFLLYRPVLLKLLPAFLGSIFGILDKITDWLAKVLIVTGSMFAGLLDVLTDSTVVLLRNTVYRDSIPQTELEEGNIVTHCIGLFLNKLEELLNRIFWKDSPRKLDFEHWFVLKTEFIKENLVVIGRSLSYGLVLFCLGLCATLIYLLVFAFR